MLYHIRYFRDPLARAWPKQTAKGMRLLDRGKCNLVAKLRHPGRHITPRRNGRRCVHGLAYLYGFRYFAFFNDNHVTDTLAGWITLAVRLDGELKAIHAYPNISTLIRSRYARHISVAGIERYYHPRRRHFVRNDRSYLAALAGGRHRFTACFVRFGSKRGHRLTVLLRDVRWHGKRVASHVWLNATQSIRSLGHLDTGCTLAFDARVALYRKGNLRNGSPIKHYDYGLSRPTKATKIQLSDT